MPIPFDHVQKAMDANQIMGNSTTTITLPPGPYTDKEVWRSWINPGYAGDIALIEGALRFKAYASGPTNSVAATWKWQIRPEGQSVWTDLHTAVSDTFTANVERVQSVIFEASSETLPFELRLVFSTTDTDDSIIFILSSVTANASILRIVGVTQ